MGVEQSEAKPNIVFIGLGVMGAPMAGHLAKAGYPVAVYNRSPEKSTRWQAQYDGEVLTDLGAGVSDKTIVITCVGNDDDLRQVAYGSGDTSAGILQNLQAGAIWIDHSTVSASLSRELYAAAKAQGAHFLDAPVSGGQAGAENGALSIMVGGDQVVFQQVRALLAVYGKTVQRIGESGAGQLCKMVNQICVGGLLQALAEALSFGKAAGLDMDKVIAVISGGAAQSWQMQNRASTMLKGEYDFGFAVDWMRKDFGIVFDEAKQLGLELPVTQMVDGFYQEVQAMGGGRWDTSSLIALQGKHS